ncbi:hypothetical protein CYV19_11300 [Natronobacterium gregoryi SP2]|uniref:Uncharacterized protein n=1 Tax=Natronobacterium gregoryi (strain ATCC 43098 / DSM 3393 / CCM 3738 / CIP 104747 / IAM 13177 / JCM 8860 / NBRC 102187 / NCIMB 2189 / SP2) TaxID=797304 RepID=A0A2J4JDZ8_NATGS|nr:hypothetical protein CYV19_11300 [Natronobacterium gregoryi SP2]
MARFRLPARRQAKPAKTIHTAGQNDVTIGRSAGAVTEGDGRESAADFVLTSTRQYHQPAS